MRLSIAILAGGESRRFGTDKAAFRIGEDTLLERVAAAARDTGLPVAVVGRTAPKAWSWSDVDFHPDREPGLGPMGGLLTALQDLDSAVLAVGCDMPRLDPDALNWLANQALEAELADGLVSYEKGGVLQPLFSVYTPSSIPLMERLMKTRMRSLHALVSAGSFQVVRIPDRYLKAVRGINTPEEAEELALELAPETRRGDA